MGRSGGWRSHREVRESRKPSGKRWHVSVGLMPTEETAGHVKWEREDSRQSSQRMKAQEVSQQLHSTEMIMPRLQTLKLSSER